jgi:ribonuclease HI
VKWLFEGVVRPAFSYGCHVWGRNTSLKGFLEKARKLHRLALLPMSPVRTKCPTAGLEVLAGLLPLELFIEKTYIKTYLRIQHLLPNWDGIGRGNLRGHSFGLSKLTLPLNLPITNLQDKTKIITSPTLDCPLEMENFQIPDTNQQTTILIYTDGSKTKYGLGADSNNKFQPIITQSYKLPDYSTVFKAEVEAINHGAILALEISDKTKDNLNKYGNLSKHTFHFISDSKASLMVIHKRTTNSKTVLICTNNLKLLLNRNPITLNWIKAHNNHPGNELANFLAKKAQTQPHSHLAPLITTSPIQSTPHSLNPISKT